MIALPSATKYTLSNNCYSFLRWKRIILKFEHEMKIYFVKIHLQCENISTFTEPFQVSKNKMVPCNQLTLEHKETKGELSLLFNTIYCMIWISRPKASDATKYAQIRLHSID